ncbi:hypothetical protein LIER_39245 [Lithospermum erythrorhizon]|uniref:DYW domain-containing protein n=1 Tax=Lithospermum erythrorhizon TaxID=34254 RepID=A0AAV3QCS9_LITER
MAILSQNLSTTLTTTSTPTLNLNNLCTNKSLKFPKISHTPLKTPPLNQETSAKEAFATLSQILTQKREHFDEAFASVLELCSTKQDLPFAQQIHAHILKCHYVKDLVFLNTKLVFGYGKMRFLLEAQKVFDEMCDRSVYTWNAMIGGYVTNDEPLQALELYKEMRLLDFPLDGYSISSILKGCGLIDGLDIGREIHGFATKMGLVDSFFVVNSIVGMYVKCHEIITGVLVFQKLGHIEDVVSWNAIISGYSASGMKFQALEVFHQMCDFGIVPSTYTFVAVLKACEEPEFGKVGRSIHAMLLKSTCYINVYVANALIIMYARTDKMVEADNVFRMTYEKDSISWNSMLSGYVQNGCYVEAIDLFSEMILVGVKPDKVSVISIIAACGRSRNLSVGIELHGYALKKGLDCDVELGNSLMDMYVKCGKIDYVDFIFQRLDDKDYISWTTIIAGYAQNNYQFKAVELFREVINEGIHVDSSMISSILLACSVLKSDSLVKELHSYVIRRRITDVYTKKSLMNAYGDSGNINYARKNFMLLDNHDIVSFTSMISCYVNNGLAYEALELFLEIKETGLQLDEVSVLSALTAAGDLSALRKGKEIHGFLVRKNFIADGAIASSLVSMYASCGTIEDSCTVFKYTEVDDVVLWTSMINAYGMHGFGKSAIDLYTQMEDQNIVPDPVTFLALLHACSHSGFVDEGKMLFQHMQHKYKLQPWPEHYVCLVDMLGRANYLDEAFKFVEEMSMKPTSAVWSALLGACRIHSNRKLGDIAAKKLLELDPQNPGNYVLASNIYAEAGRWEDVEEVRQSMKIKGLKKDPACSWIEVGSKIHSFTAHDKSHPESNIIYQRLAFITEKLEKEGGYIAQTKYVLHNVDDKQKPKMLYGHSERLAISYGLLSTADGTPIRVMKNLRVCGDCHTYIKLASKLLERDIIVRDANRFHHFKDGSCSCNDMW